MIVGVIFKPGGKVYGYKAPDHIKVGDTVSVMVGPKLKQVPVVEINMVPDENITYKEIQDGQDDKHEESGN